MYQDLITRSLHRLLRCIRTEFDTFNCHNSMKKLGCESSTCFYVTQKNKVMTFSIDIAPKLQTIYFTVIPWFECIHKTNLGLDSYEKRWNMLGSYSRLNIYSEKNCDGKYIARIHLSSMALSDINGLTRQLWLRHIEVLTNEALRAWAEIEALEKSNAHKSFDGNDTTQYLDGLSQNSLLN